MSTGDFGCKVSQFSINLSKWIQLSKRYKGFFIDLKLTATRGFLLKTGPLLTLSVKCGCCNAFFFIQGCLIIVKQSIVFAFSEKKYKRFMTKFECNNIHQESFCSAFIIIERANATQRIMSKEQ